MLAQAGQQPIGTDQRSRDDSLLYYAGPSTAELFDTGRESLFRWWRRGLTDRGRFVVAGRFLRPAREESPHRRGRAVASANTC